MQGDARPNAWALWNSKPNAWDHGISSPNAWAHMHFSANACGSSGFLQPGQARVCARAFEFEFAIRPGILLRNGTAGLNFLEISDLKNPYENHAQTTRFRPIWDRSWGGVHERIF